MDIKDIKSDRLNIVERNNLVYVSFPHIEKTGIVNHCFSTRLGGVSEGIYSSLNLGYNRGDKEANVDENFRRICDTIEVDSNDLIYSNQVHNDEVQIVGIDDLGKGKSVDFLFADRDICK